MCFIKCDRGKPHCKTCEKYNSTELCSYVEPTWTNTNGRKVTFVNHTKFVNDNDTKSRPQGTSSESSPTGINKTIVEIRSGYSNESRNFFNGKGDSYNSPTMAINGLHNDFSASSCITNSPHMREQLADSILFGSSSGIPSSISSGLSPMTKPILPPLQSLTAPVSGVPAISLQPLIPSTPHTPQTQMQNQAELQALLNKIKTSDANINITSKDKDLDTAIIEKSAMTWKSPDPAPTPAMANTNIKPHNGLENKQSHSNISTAVSNGLESSNPVISTLDNQNRTLKRNFSADSSYSALFQSLGIAEDDSFNLYEGLVPMLYKFSRINNFGPLAWISNVLKDPFICPLRDEIVQHKKKTLFKATCEGETDHQNRFLRFSGLDDIKPMNIEVHPVTENQTESDAQLVKESMLNKPYDGTELNTQINPKCIYFNTNFALQQILKVLPKKKVIWLLIKRFFTYVYPLLPYIDQFSFIADVEKLIDGNHFRDRYSEEKIATIHVTKKLDFANLGILLLVLKFAETSLVVNEDPGDGSIPRTKDEQYLLEHPLDEKMINVAQSCLNQFKLLRRCALPVFQLALLMNKYEKLNGLADGNDSDNQIFIAMLMQMAISIGMNRDPSKFDTIIGKGRIGNLWRKIWYGLLSSDVEQYIQFGSGKSAMCDFYDTELPTFDEESSNIDNYDLERVVIEKIRLNYEFNQVMLDLADYLCQFRKHPNIRVVMKKLFNLESMLIESFGTMKDLLNRDGNLLIEKIRKVWDFTIYVLAVGLLITVYHQLFVHYQKLQNYAVAKFVKEKSQLHWLYVFSNFKDITNKSYKYFGVGFDVVLGQCIISTVHKGWIDYMSTYICLGVAFGKIEESGNNNKRLQLMKKIAELIGDSENWYLPSLKILSRRHFHAWKLLKAHSYIIGLIRKNQFMFKPLMHLYDFVEYMSDSELMNLVELTKYKNYITDQNESKAFLAVKKQILENCTSPKSISTDSPTSDSTNTADGSNPVPDISIEGLFPIEAWNKPMEEDTFWRDMFFQKQQNTLNGPTPIDSPGFEFLAPQLLSQEIYPDTDYNMNIPLEGQEISPGSNPSQHNTSNPTNLFVDQTIYNMFS